jgi:hypothetical protein
LAIQILHRTSRALKLRESLSAYSHEKFGVHVEQSKDILFGLKCHLVIIGVYEGLYACEACWRMYGQRRWHL